MGCGCNKKAVGGGGIPSSRRVTVYEVQVNGNSISEYSSLPEARSEAIKLGGRVKVSTKVVAA